MKNVFLLAALLLLSFNAYAQHNAVVPQTSTLSTFVANPLFVQSSSGAESFTVFQVVLELPVSGMLPGANQWQFNIGGEPGKTVHVEFFEPTTESPGAPILTGGWHDNSGPILTQTKDYLLSVLEPDFDTWYQLDNINATNATIGNKTFIIKLIYSYLL